MTPTLRQYQIDAIRQVRDEFSRGALGVILTAPTGSGKTYIFSFIAESAGRRGKNILILVHRQELLSQCSDALTSLGVNHGIIAPGRTLTRDHVQVASVQTLIRRLNTIPDPDLIICDECHHLSRGSSWGKIVDSFPRARLLGVTATPTRLDGKPLGRNQGGYFDALVIGPTPLELMKAGYLSELITYSFPSADTDGIHKTAGDYNAAELAECLEKSHLLDDAVTRYSAICPGVPAIVFCINLRETEKTAKRFRDAGYTAETIDGMLDDKTRRYRIHALETGKIQVLVSCQLVEEGTDIPSVIAGIDLQPTLSLRRYMQRIGRLLRPASNKTYAIQLDHAGNFRRHRYVQETRAWSLENQIKPIASNGEKNTCSGYWQCMECYAIMNKPRARICNQCGAERVYQDKNIRVISGNLVYIDPVIEENERIKAEISARNEKLRKNARIHAALSIAKKAGTKSAFMDAAVSLGYKPGWGVYRWLAWKERLTQGG